MGEGSVDQAVECRLMSGVRRGAHDLDLEVFGNVTRIGVRDIRGRVLLAVLNLDHTQAVVQYPLVILVADYKLQRCLVRIVELMRLRFFAVVLCDIRRGLDGHVVFPRLIRSRRFRPVERLALRVVDQVVVFRPAAGRADVLYLNLPDSRFQIVIGGSRNKRGLRIFCFPDRVDGLGRIVLGQRNLVAAMVLHNRSIRIVCPAKERVAVAGGNCAGNGERCLAGVGLGSLRSRCAFAAVSVVVKDVGFFGHRLVMGDVDVNGSFGAAELPLGEGCIPVPRCSLCCGLTVFQIMRTIFAALRVVGIQILVGVERHDTNPRIGALGQNRAVVGDNIAEGVCIIYIGDITKPRMMVIGITPHVDSAFGGAGRVDIVAVALYVRYGGLVGFLNFCRRNVYSKRYKIIVPAAQTASGVKLIEKFQGNVGRASLERLITKLNAGIGSRPAGNNAGLERELQFADHIGVRNRHGIVRYNVFDRQIIGIRCRNAGQTLIQAHFADILGNASLREILVLLRTSRSVTFCKHCIVTGCLTKGKCCVENGERYIDLVAGIQRLRTDTVVSRKG